ncbi:MAG: ATP-binding protein, partial [Anaerolineales bacterium]
MTLDTSLDALETAGLVQAVAKEPETEYEFRHGLLQETAYGLLLKRERKQLHQQVGAAIEDRYPERTKEMAPILANHFLKGGHQKKALQYLRLAGENARNRFANAEALEHFTSALEVTRELNQPLDEADLLRERGLTFEIVGEFEAAQEDFEAGLSIGEELEETKIQWSALLDLGKLWAAKDYDLSGDYFKEALALARKIDDAELIARSLNRLGNWHINVGNPKQAQSHHREALEIFEALDDREGIAETLDFLGMSSMLSGDLISGAKYYERAIDLLRSINDKQRLVSSLVPYALRYNDSMAEPVVGADVAPKEPLANYDEAIELARELGWRAGESFALWSRAFLLNSLGRLDDAHNSGHK